MLEVDEADAVVLLLKKGLGIMFAPELAWQKRAHFMPHKLRITDPGCTVTTGIAWSRKHYLSLAAERFRQFVIAYSSNLMNDWHRTR
jgi:DNA-binding transcriptional LysR family regulator